MGKNLGRENTVILTETKIVTSNFQLKNAVVVQNNHHPQPTYTPSN